MKLAAGEWLISLGMSQIYLRFNLVAILIFPRGAGPTGPSPNLNVPYTHPQCIAILHSAVSLPLPLTLIYHTSSPYLFTQPYQHYNLNHEAVGNTILLNWHNIDHL